MASKLCNVFHFLLYSHFLLFCSISSAQTSFSPKALVLPVIKDLSTSQYLTQISQRTLLVPVKLSIHLGGQTLWVDCEHGFTSSTYWSAICGSPQCTIAKPNTCSNCTSTPTPRPGCNKNACLNTPENPFINTLYDGGEIAEDIVLIQSTNGYNPGQVVKVPQFIFTCVPTFLTEGLASGVKGTAGLGRNGIALPSQFARAFGFARKFAMCLSSSTSSRGAVFFGDGPYVMLPNINVSKSLIYTPLFISPFGTGYVPYLNEPSSEYFIGVKAINVNGKAVPVNRKLLAIDKRGNGGTKISTGKAYTVMQTSIYNAVSKAFAEGLSNVSRVNKDVICLAFVDGGLNPTKSIVIGGYQIEDNLLQFGIANSRLGFSSSLLFRQTTCANFNFTSQA
ncbi:hypothetical protein ACH5RR_033359 [Cinchona calisaya]|uniref:Peptidase A1 domain-containing protein n=1 Tax=Cinchona calisaya TaxID=153742 RepID=A0ABD2YQ46_9GENT